MKKAIEKALIVLIIIAGFALSFWAMPLLPEKIAAHWNSYGRADSFWSKEAALFLMPLISIVLAAVLLIIPKLDPLKKNIQEVQDKLLDFVVILLAFLLYVHALTIAWNLGFEFNLIQFMAPGLGILFFAAGNLMKGAKQNWFVGIRTPWTLSSERVWNITHKKASLAFKIAGILAMLATFVPEFAIWLILVPIILAAVYSIVLSFVEFKKEENEYKARKAPKTAKTKSKKAKKTKSNLKKRKRN